MNKKLLLPIAIACFSASQASQSIAKAVLEEVLVTARKQTEALQETPIAITAFDAEALRAGQMDDMADIARQVPGLTVREGVYESAISIRGVGARARGANIDPGVGVYVDGIFMPRSDTQLVDVVNTASVQVLRGPQGTLFGKNTAGGAVLVETQKPGAEFESSVLGRLGDYDQQDLRATVSGPLVDEVLLGSLTLDSRSRAGYMSDGETGRDYGNVDNQSVMGQLRWLPRDDLTIDLFAYRNQQQQQAAPATCLFVNPDATIPANNLTTPGESRDVQSLCEQSYALAEQGQVLMDRSPALRYETTNTMLGLTLDWQLSDSVSLKSITGYLQQDGLERDTDQDATPLYTILNKSEIKRHLNANGYNTDDEQRRFISQELQLNAKLDDWLDYTVGLFASIEKIDGDIGGNVLGPGGYAGVGLGDDVFVLTPATAGFNNAQISDFENKSAAVFAHGIFHLNERWDLTLGVRYGREDKEVSQLELDSITQSPGIISRSDFDALATATQQLVLSDQSKKNDSWSKLTPTAQLSMLFADDWLEASGLDEGMLYLSASSGFKSGGFSRFGADLLSYEPEQLSNYEMGLKLDLNERRLRINAALFRSDYEDMQLTVARQTSPLAVETGLTNAGQASINGAELEVTYLPIEGLLLSASASWLDAQYDEFMDVIEGESFDRSGEDFAFVPKRTLSLNARYQWMTAAGKLTPSLSGYYTDEVFIGIDALADDFKPQATLASYSLWNARLSWVPETQEQLEVSLYVNNLVDKNYFANGSLTAETLGVANLRKGMPRSYGLELYYQW